MERERSSLYGLALALALAATPVLAQNITGQWDFTNGDLSATVGAALEYGNATTAGNTSFGKTTDFGIPAIVPTDAAGTPIGPVVDARVMRFPKMASGAEGYKMWPGAAANGTSGASDVNQYSVVMDILYPAASNNLYRALFQTSSDNSNDADFFVGDGSVSPSPNGIGISGQYDGTIAPDTWYRVALVVNLEAASGESDYFKYINGKLVGSQDAGSSGGRFAVWSTASGNPSWVFSDNDGEAEQGYVRHVAFYDGALSARQVEALGGLANGVIPEPSALALLACGGLILLRRR